MPPDVSPNTFEIAGFPSMIMESKGMLPLSMETLRTFLMRLSSAGNKGPPLVSLDPIIGKWIVA